jgi:hypothetical protein
MEKKHSIMKRIKRVLSNSSLEEYWNLNDQTSLKFNIEKNGGEYLIIKGTKKALEYLAGILSDKNVPHRNLKKQINIHILTPDQLESAVKEVNIPFEITFQRNM